MTQKSAEMLTCADITARIQNALDRVTQPLFHTVHGLPIYHGDNFWCFYEGQKQSANRVRAHAKWDYNDGEPRFSTKEEAQEAIRVYKWLNEPQEDC
jgi:hypothetical protein